MKLDMRGLATRSESASSAATSTSASMRGTTSAWSRVFGQFMKPSVKPPPPQQQQEQQ
eukprot:CAMPEP_0197609914 /NCGR_PEP_ID=MMETSP1326-20131121/52190_1 /TAXON_ID=1155430 /ORGANISM="Genus nov. species nov., Strain RCC2288" /LENGTH=57 /DNA_ID=CAMNT_0043178347 /DNA_START=29 /DNA_END=199 /DNA_ORIENTATION=-